MNEFTPFPKISRLFRRIIVTEKLDGTNGQVFIWDENADVLVKGTHVLAEGTHDQSVKAGPPPEGIPFLATIGSVNIAAGSRNRWLTIEKDNFNFARWVRENASELAQLGHGRHFGEWWGLGIQRGYGITEKRFSLFNTIRWCPHGQEPKKIETQDPRIEKYQDVLPACCHLVPVLYEGMMSTLEINDQLICLEENGSEAAPGFMNPEGIIIYHTASNQCFKYTLDGDGHKRTR